MLFSTCFVSDESLWNAARSTVAPKADSQSDAVGTMIFIPAYWSFDPKRDLNWLAIMALHKARGVPKQEGGCAVRGIAGTLTTENGGLAWIH